MRKGYLSESSGSKKEYLQINLESLNDEAFVSQTRKRAAVLKV